MENLLHLDLYPTSWCTAANLNKDKRNQLLSKRGYYIRQLTSLFQSQSSQILRRRSSCGKKMRSNFSTMNLISILPSKKEEVLEISMWSMAKKSLKSSKRDARPKTFLLTVSWLLLSLILSQERTRPTKEKRIRNIILGYFQQLIYVASVSQRLDQSLLVA